MKTKEEKINNCRKTIKSEEASGEVSVVGQRGLRQLSSDNNIQEVMKKVNKLFPLSKEPLAITYGIELGIEAGKQEALKEFDKIIKLVENLGSIIYPRGNGQLALGEANWNKFCNEFTELKKLSSSKEKT